MDLYSEYQKYVGQIIRQNTLENFKQNPNYTYMLEHVNEEQGKQYLYHIKELLNDSFYSKLNFSQIHSYLIFNDSFGNPKKSTFTYDNQLVFCSPSSLRYVLQSLLILKHIHQTNSKKLIELGCGYGGLFLAINFFSKLLNIEINKYYMIDLPEICDLIQKYLEYNRHLVSVEYETHSSVNYGADINDSELFFISNYCFTEIAGEHRDNYVSRLFPKISNGFIIWQTCFGLTKPEEHIFGIKKIMNVVEEYPQTAFISNKNYYVYF